MKFALAQMEVLPGNPRKNCDTMLALIRKAKDKGVHLIVFPELCISGYILMDKWIEDSFCEELMKYNDELLQASRGIAIAYGNIYIDNKKREGYHPNKDGRSRKYNAVYVVQNEKYVKAGGQHTVLPDGVRPKTLLPEYRIFDDERYFFSLQDVAKDYNIPLEELVIPFNLELDGIKKSIGFEVCEDLWCADYRRSGHSLNVTQLLIDNGAEIIVNISASPWNYGKNHARDDRIKFLKEEIGERFVPFLYVNKCGAQNNGKNIITFDGGTTVYDKNADPVLLVMDSYQQNLLCFDDASFQSKPLVRKEKSKTHQKYEAIITGLRHLKIITGNPDPKFVIGLSGGIDSGVVASLLCSAFGKQNILAANMPSKFNAPLKIKAAESIASALGIDLISVPIDTMADEIRTRLSELDKKYLPEKWMMELSDENIQAKIRATSILSNIAGRYGWYFTNNGNKLEIALGYTTLYGDMNGVIAPIGDLTKKEVFEMGKFLNEKIFKKEIIPSVLFPDEVFRFQHSDAVPGPELKSKQVSPIKYGYHCALIDVLTDFLRKSPEDLMQWFLDGTMEKNLKISGSLIKGWEMDNAEKFIGDMEWFVSSIKKSVFKRVQAPPIIITGKSAYGFDIRESMLPFIPSGNYTRLKNEVIVKGNYWKQ